MPLLGCLCILTGLALLAYPRVRQRLYREHMGDTIAWYEQVVAGEVDDPEGVYRLIRAYNQTLFQEGQRGLVNTLSYQRVDLSLVELGFAEEMIGYLDIPRMDVTLPVYLGASEENMARGAAHMTQTSIPVGGENTNAVIAAHRDMTSAVMFRDIDLLEAGDRVTFTNFRETLVYEVYETLIVQPDEVDQILIQEGRDLLTLLSCHPYLSNRQRYLVRCERVE